MRQTSPFEQLRVVFFFVAPLPSAAVSRFSHSVGRVAPFRDKVLEQGAYKEAAKRASLYIFRRVYIRSSVLFSRGCCGRRVPAWFVHFLKYFF